MTMTLPRITIPSGQNQPVQMRPRQAELKEGYEASPSSAMVTDHARSFSTRIPAVQPLYGSLEIGTRNAIIEDIALHKGVGGLSDKPVPGDILCGAIAGCLDSVIRVIANHLGIELTELEVCVEADVDLRGTLMMDQAVPVGFQTIRVDVRMEPSGDVPDATLSAILMAAERCCVVVQTLRNPPKIEISRSTPYNAAEAIE